MSRDRRNSSKEQLTPQELTELRDQLSRMSQSELRDQLQSYPQCLPIARPFTVTGHDAAFGASLAGALEEAPADTAVAVSVPILCVANPSHFRF